ncbi:chromosome segregation protein SMC [Roseitranquillus sediminis]|uniref:chromosome segregation protein SMC n=1 Tax=Roseitranquillus sediminis TaxID=2809051 RepID=UPI001D0C0C2A|nr:chromosome segregation protein SMC [Roseitranquillus sediminis]MBM9593639.1 chromosome segregation protein SMC [Roseitranquillus sediminis]
MRFNRLRLTGFKSFVDPTDLTIAEGLTGVVGPNGCGKSNLLEALRWVMGENRPTAMRGGGMEDVIFAGAATRPARNFAEVALLVDNSERRAPQGFNDSDVLEVVRRITRDAGSAYKANGRDVRARDVQMLFADASTGAHSPALVRQGQISELINAKPVARRRILEEAAGISGLYQRRHEAELKLNGAETNLARVDDVVEQLASQLGSLARQARQAAKYREIGAALRQAEGVLLWRRWRDAEDQRTAAEAELAEALRAASEAERAARAAAAAREQAAEALPPLREEAAIAGALMQRLDVERDTLKSRREAAETAIRTLTGRAAQLERDVEREESLNGDATGTLQRLDDEARRLRDEAEGHDDQLAEAAHAAEDAAETLREHEDALSDMTEKMAVLVARRQSMERAAAESRTAVSRAEAEVEGARQAQETAREALRRAAAACDETEARRGAAVEAAGAADEALAETDAARADVQAREADAGAAHAAAAREAKTLEAETAALERLLRQERASGNRLLDSVSVASGFEAALGAALADDLEAPLAEGDGPGWAALPDLGPQEAPPGARPLAELVEGPSLLTRRLTRTFLVARSDGARLQPALRPGQRLVSVEGDLWRWDGLRTVAASAASRATLRLQQANRLAELEAALAKAQAALETTARDHEAARERLDALVRDERRHREVRRAAEEAASAAARALSRAEAERNSAQQRLEGAEQSGVRHAREAEQARGRLAEAEAALHGLGDLTAARAAIDEAKTTVEAVRLAMLTRRSAHDELRRAGEARERRLKGIAADRETWSRRLETAESRLADLRARREKAAAELAAAEAAPAALAEEEARLRQAVETAEGRRRKADDALAAAETAERAAENAAREAERRAGAAREARAARQARAEAAGEAAGAAVARIADEAEATPEALAERLGEAATGARTASEIEHEISGLRHRRDALGAVNLRAEEDARSVREEHDMLLSEKADLEEAICALRHGIAGLNREGRERLLTAFEQVNENFATLFTHLFGGGEARLELVESDDPLEAGLEILCQPPGKKLSALSLLSGGEQTLTALALIFAVFLANPAPICVLDEVDAPLDDANVTRFCNLLDEMTRRTDTRFLIITHHAVTMSRMDRLFGVTMGEQGVSQLVSVDLRAAESLVA